MMTSNDVKKTKNKKTLEQSSYKIVPSDQGISKQPVTDQVHKGWTSASHALAPRHPLETRLAEVSLPLPNPIPKKNKPQPKKTMIFER